MAAHTNGAVVAAPTIPLEARHVPLPPELPPNQLNGIEEFAHMRNWVSFDNQRGKLVCRNLNFDTDEFTGMILESRVVRVLKDEDGNVFCSSTDRLVSDTGRPGYVCQTCEDRDATCFPRWWIAWQELDSGLIFAHTLSQTGSLNFNRYANGLLREGVQPGQVLTRIFVEEAKRKKTNATYRRVQFERMDGEIPDPFRD
jgi:hypothetical protein